MSIRVVRFSLLGALAGVAAAFRLAECGSAVPRTECGNGLDSADAF